jgi:hypothetical protein
VCCLGPSLKRGKFVGFHIVCWFLARKGKDLLCKQCIQTCASATELAKAALACLSTGQHAELEHGNPGVGGTESGDQVKPKAQCS